MTQTPPNEPKGRAPVSATKSPEPTRAANVEPKQVEVLIANILRRVDGGWVRITVEIPADVLDLHPHKVSDVDVFGMHVSRLAQDLNRQKEGLPA